MNKTSRKSGLEFQRWCKNWLDKSGYITHNQIPMGRMVEYFDKKSQRKKKLWLSGRNDIFGWVDLLAVGYKKMLMIQATMDKAVEKRLQEMAIPTNDDLPVGCEKQIWQKVCPGLIRILDGNDGKEIARIIRGTWYTSHSDIGKVKNE